MILRNSLHGSWVLTARGCHVSAPGWSFIDPVRNLNHSSRRVSTFIVTEDNILSQQNKKRCQLLMKDMKLAKPGKKMKLAAVFPGGKHDASDRDLLHTAVREAVEEIGLQEADIDVWGMLDRWAPTSDRMTAVYPIVAYCGEIDPSSLLVNHDERRRGRCVLSRMIAEQAFRKLGKGLFHHSRCMHHFIFHVIGECSRQRFFHNKHAQSLADFVVTEQNILSDENKQRFQHEMDQVACQHPRSSRTAAVLVPLCTVDGVPSILFTRRATTLRSDSRLVCFPGGQHDSSDRDYTHTAVRETVEETGIQERNIDVWGPIKVWIPSYDLSTAVTVVVANIGATDIKSLTYNSKEVNKLFTCPMSALYDLRNIGYTTFRRPVLYSNPVFLAEHQIWGLTAFALHFTLRLVAKNLYQFSIDIDEGWFLRNQTEGYDG